MSFYSILGTKYVRKSSAMKPAVRGNHTRMNFRASVFMSLTNYTLGGLKMKIGFDNEKYLKMQLE